MRTTLDLPENLVNTAMKITHEKTKTGLITHALEHLIRRSRIQPLKRFRGKIDLQINLDYLRKRK
jgi:Bacterial antitoxin of type II TA system, VapB